MAFLAVGISSTAAEEAEAVASISCSGHGRAYLDGLIVDGKPVCECNNCYRGADCSEFISDCPADAEGFALISQFFLLIFSLFMLVKKEMIRI